MPELVPGNVVEDSKEYGWKDTIFIKKDSECFQAIKKIAAHSNK